MTGASQPDADPAKTPAQPAGCLVNCMVVWRYESSAVEAFGDAMEAEPAGADDNTAKVISDTLGAGEQRT